MKKLNIKSITANVVPVATMAVGFATAKVVPFAVNKVYSPKGGLSNTIIGVSELAAGLFLSSMKNKYLQNVGIGIAISGLHTFLEEPVNTALKAAGFAGIQYSGRRVVTGNYNVTGIGCPIGTPGGDVKVQF